MKKTYRIGTTWEAISKERRYRIVYRPECFAPLSCFHVEITDKDGNYLGARNHWSHYASFGTLRGATGYCRTTHFEELTFRRTI